MTSGGYSNTSISECYPIQQDAVFKNDAVVPTPLLKPSTSSGLHLKTLNAVIPHQTGLTLDLLALRGFQAS